MKTKLLLITLSLFFAFSFKNLAQQVDSTKIEFEKLTHDFGVIEQGGDGSYVFKFKNVGNKPLILSNVRSSCGCTVPSWPKEPIPPGGTGEIKVTYNTNILGKFSKTITVYANAPTVTLRIQGEVKSPETK